ncbi:hypothetical protein PIB30_034243 [Stylosanthes scabra]|uniref:Uncharacterized protein n=1 Tax=Stylosanthes scabra TaxID=79078 RepID=A0ABU6VBF8_9FABA|nr:hypothetical protein [Stylosanthes scabra]
MFFHASHKTFIRTFACSAFYIDSFIVFISSSCVLSHYSKRFIKQSSKGAILFVLVRDLQKMESNLGDMLLKVAVFFVVQALVYLILSNSSNLFSKNIKRTHSFKPARSVSVRRMLALLSDFPAEGEPSPSSKSPQSPSPNSYDKKRS